MKSNRFRLAYLALFLLAALPVYAQTGCTDSPENPTAVLALLGVAGMAYSPVKAKLTSLWRKNR
jgi:XrtJ-associated TM-motif-TM protein